MLPVLYYLYTEKVPILRLGKKWLVFDSRFAEENNCLRMGIRHAAGHRANGKIAIQALVNTMGVSVAAALRWSIGLMTLQLHRNRILPMP